MRNGAIEKQYRNMNDKDEHCHQMKPIMEIHESDFEMEVLKSKQPVLVNFRVDWS